MKIKVLIVDDKIDQFYIIYVLCNKLLDRIELHWVSNLTDAIELINSGTVKFDIKFLDMIGTSIGSLGVFSGKLKNNDFVLISNSVHPIKTDMHFIEKPEIAKYIETYLKSKEVSNG